MLLLLAGTDLIGGFTRKLHPWLPNLNSIKYLYRGVFDIFRSISLTDTPTRWEFVGLIEDQIGIFRDATLHSVRLV